MALKGKKTRKINGKFNNMGSATISYSVRS
jgi:hypothetical protein